MLNSSKVNPHKKVMRQKMKKAYSIQFKDYFKTILRCQSVRFSLLMIVISFVVELVLFATDPFLNEGEVWTVRILFYPTMMIGLILGSNLIRYAFGFLLITKSVLTMYSFIIHTFEGGIETTEMLLLIAAMVRALAAYFLIFSRVFNHEYAFMISIKPSYFQGILKLIYVAITLILIFSVFDRLNEYHE